METKCEKARTNMIVKVMHFDHIVLTSMRGPTAGLHKVRENTVSESCIQGDDEACLWQNVQLMRRHVLRRPEPEPPMDEFDEINDFFGDSLSDNGADENDESSNVLNNLLEKENREVAKKRTVTRPQPKLNEATLTGPKGIEALRNSFSNYKPDLKKDPYENLAVMLKKYEHWAHVMFPKLKFEDVVSRCETLGDKRPVKVYMMKSRLGMKLTDEDFAPVRRKKGDEIIETENNEDDAGRIRERDSSDDEENYYDPLESAHSSAEEEERRRREEAELAMVNEVMEDFDMY
ncbi:unnamed protein product [Nippostrongylus brasiliensis]|uniref:TIMELESS-interacting protein n=1 Tax=Nippostrongylus brasiliensis TaxID=27835 RepID=A0A158R1I7_NIPBR|nr:unnamed protein product [Nippostrongylus brasiliensis]